MRSNPRTPKYFQRFLKWFCEEDFFEELQGDLEENFLRNQQVHGTRKARFIYKKEVIKLLRPSVIRRTKTRKHYNHSAMFKNYTVVAFRNLLRNKLFSTINIIGLSISMAVGLLAIAFTSEIYSFDNFHENKDRIYRVVSDVTRPNRGTSSYATTSILTGKRLASDFASFEHVAPVYRGLRGEITKNEKTISLKGIYANNDFFKVFSFKMIYGNPETALTEPYSIILTEDLAFRLFRKTDVLGETLDYSTGDILKITGVIQNPPKNSHISFDAIGTLETLERKDSYTVKSWRSITSSYVYGLVPKGTQNLDQVQANLNQIAKEENEKVEGINITLALEALDDIFPGVQRSNQFQTTMPASKVNAIIIMALIVIISACFNYTNLSIARSLKRAKEVGVRKVVGARKLQLISQFVIESIFISLFALLLACLLFRLIRPEFLALDFYIQRTTTLELTSTLYLYFIVFAILVGALAGLIPALLMSNFKPVRILKGAAFTKAQKGIGFRKLMTGLQFTLSMGFLILVTLIFKQYKFALNYDLGFTTENILNVDLQNNDPEILKPLFSQVPEVTGISSSSMISSTGSSQSAYAKGSDPQDSITVYTFDISHDYINNLNHQLIAGPGFEEGLEKGKVVINELFVKRIGYDSPQDAIDQPITFLRKKWIIAGVVKDFQFRTTDESLEPFVFTSKDRTHYYLNVQLVSNDIVGTMKKLDRVWSVIDPNHQFQARFFKEDIERTYTDVSSSMKTYGLLAIIAISISVLGLLGMAVYTAESKKKELTVRKVLGAKIPNLMLLLSKNFLLTFVISAAVAIPSAYLMFQRTIVQDAVYKIDVGFWELSAGALVIIFIAFATISSQTLKAARVNPAENLRNE